MGWEPESDDAEDMQKTPMIMDKSGKFTSGPRSAVFWS